MHMTRKRSRQLADTQKRWERVDRPSIGEGEIRHQDLLWEKPIDTKTLEQLTSCCRVTHHGAFGMVTGAALFDGSALVEPTSLPLSRRIVGPRGIEYQLISKGRLMRTTANPVVAWKWLALKAGVQL